MYGNYDGLNRPPIFEVYIGVNFLSTVNVSDPGVWEMLEAIVVVPDSFLQLCLVNTGSGTLFISVLELRPLKTRFYPQANATHGLALVGRANFGPTNVSYAAIVRYPDDPRDRLWFPSVDATNWTVISTRSWVHNVQDDLFPALSKVMQTAITPRNASGNIELFWEPKPVPKDPSLGYIAVMHFSELQELHWRLGYTRYNVSLNATANSTLPPMINAMEVFSLIPTTNVGTDSIDGMECERTGWVTPDPCLPKTLAWDWLACSYAVSSPPRITSLNLSFSGLNGDISSSFANLKAVQYLNLSNNNLTGSIPDALSELPSLMLLDLTGNQLSGSIPSGLLKRIQDGSLNLKYGNNPHLCTDGNSCQALKRKRKLTAVYIPIPVALAVVLLLLCFIIRRKNHGSVSRYVKPQTEPTNNAHDDDHSSLQQRNRQFTYKELQIITKNFQTVLGKGGFGYVYEGFWEDPKDRKRRQEGGNLVSMIGYCKDGEHLGLVYEYMPLGTLQQHIAGNNGRYLTWRQRLQIALESAQGLEYLHKGCSPPLIHRDVKLANILLSARLEAKVADFGLSKAFNNDDTHVATATIAGTPGYLDPEYVNPNALQQILLFYHFAPLFLLDNSFMNPTCRYHITGKPTSKSDVYSFGVVLLQLVAGRPANLRDPENTSVVQWARQRLAEGNIEAVVDLRMRGDHDINSVWKVADVEFFFIFSPNLKQILNLTRV
uniref:Protein kinase domain-containing protein n=1 Tax=Saccharum officinarum TaxID=4547 RepID=A0A678T520_SACOF|nr:hypothetical protein SO179B13_000003 [Saccharum officinarum]